MTEDKIFLELPDVGGGHALVGEDTEAGIDAVVRGGVVAQSVNDPARSPDAGAGTGRERQALVAREGGAEARQGQFAARERKGSGHRTIPQQSSRGGFEN